MIDDGLLLKVTREKRQLLQITDTLYHTKLYCTRSLGGDSTHCMDCHRNVS